MASLFKPLWYCGARDVLGAAISTGTAYFYVVGSTSQFVSLYADAAETQPITHNASNPIVLDAGGRAKVYLKTPAKVLIYDSLGSLKQTIAEGTATDAGLVNCLWGGTAKQLDVVLDEIEDNLGVGALYKESASAGVVTRPYHDVVRQFISPYDFDAEGDGLADDSAKLQAAIDRAIATGLPLNLETGSYNIASGLTISAPLRVYGDGPLNTSIISSDESFDAITINTADQTGYELRDFAITFPATAAGGKYAIKVTAGANGQFRRLNLTHEGGVSCASTGCHFDNLRITCKQIGISAGSLCSADNCQVTLSTTSSSYGIQYTTSGTARDCTVTGAGTGFSAAGSFDDCTATSCTTGFALSTSSVATKCKAVTCTTSFSVSGTALVSLLGCSSTGATYDVNAGASYFGQGNSWSFVNQDSYALQTTNTASPTFTFDPTAKVNVFNPTGNFSNGTITVAWPAPGPTLIAGQEYEIVFQTATLYSTYSGGGATVFPSEIKVTDANIGTSGKLSGGTCYSAKFRATNNSVIVQVTPWATVTAVVWV